jgi:hypothetical protein
MLGKIEDPRTKTPRAKEISSLKIQRPSEVQRAFEI